MFATENEPARAHHPRTESAKIRRKSLERNVENGDACEALSPAKKVALRHGLVICD